MAHVQKQKKHLQLAITFATAQHKILQIHSSSLHIAPQGTPSQSTVHSAKNIALDEQSNEPGRSVKNPLTAPLSTIQEFQEAADTKQSLETHPRSENANDQSRNTHIAIALDAYSTTFNQLSQQQIDASISGIDFYV